jgi:hypothetical protein
VSPDGTSEQTSTDRIYWVTRDRRVTVVLEDSLLNAPDGGAPPADISLDGRRRRLGVAFLTANRFELWTLPNDTP